MKDYLDTFITTKIFNNLIFNDTINLENNNETSLFFNEILAFSDAVGCTIPRSQEMIPSKEKEFVEKSDGTTIYERFGKDHLILITRDPDRYDVLVEGLEKATVKQDYGNLSFLDKTRPSKYDSKQYLVQNTMVFGDFKPLRNLKSYWISEFAYSNILFNIALDRAKNMSDNERRNYLKQKSHNNEFHIYKDPVGLTVFTKDLFNKYSEKKIDFYKGPSLYR